MRCIAEDAVIGDADGGGKFKKEILKIWKEKQENIAQTSKSAYNIAVANLAAAIFLL